LQKASATIGQCWRTRGACQPESRRDGPFRPGCRCWRDRGDGGHP
jgi:hypothetical protein